MADKKNLLEDWYNTSQLGDGESVVSSNMPADFQQRREIVEPQQASDFEGNNFEVEVQVEKEDGEKECPHKEDKGRDFLIKAGAMFDTARSLENALNQGAGANGIDHLKARLRNLANELIGMIDGV